MSIRSSVARPDGNTDHDLLVLGVEPYIAFASPPVAMSDEVHQ